MQGSTVFLESPYIEDCDPSVPLYGIFEIPEEVIRVNKVKLSIYATAQKKQTNTTTQVQNTTSVLLDPSTWEDVVNPFLDNTKHTDYVVGWFHCYWTQASDYDSVDAGWNISLRLNVDGTNYPSDDGWRAVQAGNGTSYWINQTDFLVFWPVDIFGKTVKIQAKVDSGADKNVYFVYEGVGILQTYASSSETTNFTVSVANSVSGSDPASFTYTTVAGGPFSSGTAIDLTSYISGTGYKAFRITPNAGSGTIRTRVNALLQRKWFIEAR